LTGASIANVFHPIVGGTVGAGTMMRVSRSTLVNFLYNFAERGLTTSSGDNQFSHGNIESGFGPLPVAPLR
jgi:hypothetical protein